MSREKKIVPKLRFKEFDEKYKLKKVEDEFNLIRNYSYSRNDEGEGKYHHVHYGDIHSRYSVYIDQGVNVPSVKTTKEHIELAYGDVIVADASEDYADLGKSTILLDQGNRKYIAGLHTFALRAQDNTNPLYFVYYSKTEQYKQYMSKIGTGTSVYGITRNNLQNMKYLAPSIEEQQKIGFFFKKIDEMIQLQQSKVNKVKDIKSAYLSEMFPKEGEKYPKKRFEGFTEPWIEYSLERIGDIVGGNSWKSNEYDKEGSHLIITIANVSGDYSVDINEGNKITPNNNRYILSEGDILISMTGNVGRVSRMPEVKAVLNQRVGKLVIDSGIDKEFIFTILQNKKFERNMILQGQGAAQLNISRTDILDYRFKIPEYNEQKKIGQLFKNINNQISVEEEKLMKLEKLKQAYLNDMFV